MQTKIKVERNYIDKKKFKEIKVGEVFSYDEDSKTNLCIKVSENKAIYYDTLHLQADVFDQEEEHTVFNAEITIKIQ